MKRAICAGLFMLVLPACATVGDPQATALSVQIVESALTASPVELRQAADQGQAGAQFSYSLVLLYGLNGTRPDAQAANAYRKWALDSRGTTTTAIYVPEGRHAGHTQLVSIPRYDISGVVAKAADDCVDALRTHAKAESATDPCGGPANYARLADLWSRARP